MGPKEKALAIAYHADWLNKNSKIYPSNCNVPIHGWKFTGRIKYEKWPNGNCDIFLEVEFNDIADTWIGFFIWLFTFGQHFKTILKTAWVNEKDFRVKSVPTVTIVNCNN